MIQILILLRCILIKTCNIIKIVIILMISKTVISFLPSLPTPPLLQCTVIIIVIIILLHSHLFHNNHDENDDSYDDYFVKVAHPAKPVLSLPTAAVQQAIIVIVITILSIIIISITMMMRIIISLTRELLKQFGEER